MSEEDIADLKQFIAATIRQSFARVIYRNELDDRLENLLMKHGRDAWGMINRLGELLSCLEKLSLSKPHSS